MKDELLKGLTAEQIEKIKACKDAAEMLKFAKEEGIELSDEQLEAVSGGCGTTTSPREVNRSCSKCGHWPVNRCPAGGGFDDSYYSCPSCGFCEQVTRTSARVRY